MVKKVLVYSIAFVVMVVAVFGILCVGMRFGL